MHKEQSKPSPKVQIRNLESLENELDCLMEREKDRKERKKLAPP